MRITTFFTLLFCALVVPLSAQKKADKKAITELIAQYETALNTHSLDGVMGIFSADAVVLRNNAPPANGHDAIRNQYKAITDASVSLNISLVIQDVIFSGDVAYAWLMNTGKVQSTGSEESTIDSKSLAVFHKGKDGWRVVRYMYNNNLSQE